MTGSGRVAVRRRAGDRLRVIGLGPYRHQQVRPQLGGPRAAQCVRPAQHLPVIWVADQVIAERGARAEHRGEPAPQPGVGAQRGEQVFVERHPGQRDQGQIRVGGRGERGQQAGVGALGIEGQVLAEQPFRPRRVRESDPGQFPGRRGPSARAHICTVTAAWRVGFPWWGSGPGRPPAARETGAWIWRSGVRPGFREGGGRGTLRLPNGSRRSGAGAVRRRPRQGGAPGGVGALLNDATGR